MNVLAIDTATERFSVALGAERDGKAETWLFEADAGMRHSELAVDCLDLLLLKAGLKAADVGGVVCTGGPGSFTGLRIGFSLAKGLALSLGIPFALVPTLDCLARPFSSWPGIAVPVLDAKKSAFFCALYREGRRAGPDMDAAPGEIALALAECLAAPPEGGPPERVLLFGPGAERLYGSLKLLPKDAPGAAGARAAIRLEKGARPGNAETLLEIARETGLFEKGRASAENLFAGPRYIRESDAEINLGAGGRIRA